MSITEFREPQGETALDDGLPSRDNRWAQSPRPRRDTMAMTRVMHRLHTLMLLIGMLLTLLGDGMRFLLLCLRPSPALAAENLFLRKQLTLYQERQMKPRRATHATHLGFIWLARWFDWRQALA